MTNKEEARERAHAERKKRESRRQQPTRRWAGRSGVGANFSKKR